MENNSPLLGRKIKEINKVEDSKLTVSVLQWNTLASCYASPKTFPLVAPGVLDFEHRKHLIAQEIKAYNADIICLEEVDKNNIDFFKSLYPEEEYSFSFAKKPHSNDGTCIMLNKRIFEILDTEIIEHYDPENNRKENLVSQVVVAKHLDSETYFIIAACHLKADTPQINFEYKRIRQAKQLLEVVEKKRQKCLELNGNKEENVSVIICGDFNDTPDSNTTKTFLENKELSLQSGFSDMEYTLFQTYGETAVLKSTIDYVLHSDNLIMTKKIGPPEEDKVSEHGLISEHYPSDHLSLYCEFTLPSTVETPLPNN